MVGKTKPATKDEKQRMESLKELPCLCCMLTGMNIVCGPTEVEHVTDRGRRLGHDKTLALGLWHHRGEKAFQYQGMTNQEMSGAFGPSLAHGRKPFEQRYGDESEVLVRLQDWVLSQDHFYRSELLDQWNQLRRMN